MKIQFIGEEKRRDEERRMELRKQEIRQLQKEKRMIGERGGEGREVLCWRRSIEERRYETRKAI